MLRKRKMEWWDNSWHEKGWCAKWKHERNARWDCNSHKGLQVPGKHYGRERMPSKKYLLPKLNVFKMWTLFCQQHVTQWKPVPQHRHNAPTHCITMPVNIIKRVSCLKYNGVKENGITRFDPISTTFSFQNPIPRLSRCFDTLVKHL